MSAQKLLHTRFPILTADEAAEFIQHGQTVGFSGFTPAGATKVIPKAIARRAQAEHDAGRPFQIAVVTGASTGRSLDGELARANAISWRTPYQSDPDLRKRINSGETRFFDMHLSLLPQNVRYGFLGKFSWAIIEADLFGNVNSTHIMGRNIMNGIGGSGDFTRNAFISIFTCPSTQKGGKISTIVPFVSHTDHSEHSVQVIVTEHGVADLRGKDPNERAQLILERCSHPDFRDSLRCYYHMSKGGHTPQTLATVFRMHEQYLKHGDMHGVDWCQISAGQS
jgi:acyl-CoA hydrolase